MPCSDDCSRDAGCPTLTCLAHSLAAEVIECEPFRPLDDATLERANAWVRRCTRVIDAGLTLGSDNARLRELLDLARTLGKLQGEAGA